jgi:nucleotide-binding universal stress UspA family protein
MGVTPKTILVPSDLGEGAEEALDYACELARSFGATITVVNVVTLPSLGVPELGVALTGSMMDSMIADNLRALEKLIESRKDRAKFEKPILKTGDPRDIINDTAKTIGADLIVMSTHGRRGVSRVLLGSVTELVVRTAPCPVLTVRMHAHAAAA